MFKRSITLGELLISALTVVGTIIAFYINTNVRLKALELNQENYRQQQVSNSTDNKAAFKEMGDKLDKLNDGQNEIKITLMNKQDRK